MQLDYAELSRELIEKVGGVSNIKSSTCCATRLRLVLKDQTGVDDEAVRRIDGVKGIIRRCGQYQIVIGYGVSNLLREFEKFIASGSDEL